MVSQMYISFDMKWLEISCGLEQYKLMFVMTIPRDNKSLLLYQTSSTCMSLNRDHQVALQREYGQLIANWSLYALRRLLPLLRPSPQQTRQLPQPNSSPRLSRAKNPTITHNGRLLTNWPNNSRHRRPRKQKNGTQPPTPSSTQLNRPPQLQHHLQGWGLKLACKFQRWCH